MSRHYPFPAEINLSRRRVINDGQEIELTVKEYDILCLLAANKGRVLTYEQIYDKVWGEISAGNEKKGYRRLSHSESS